LDVFKELVTTNFSLIQEKEYNLKMTGMSVDSRVGAEVVDENKRKEPTSSVRNKTGEGRTKLGVDTILKSGRKWHQFPRPPKRK
jgi:hypothetical protein